MTIQPNLFESLPRAPRRVLAHVIDAGEYSEYSNFVQFGCPRCGWESEWSGEYTVTESKRGIPCPRCNP